MATPTIDELARRIDALERENGELKQRLNALEAAKLNVTTKSISQPVSQPINTDNACNADDIYGIVGGIIENFNSKSTESASGNVSYMISDAALDLKVLVVNDSGTTKILNAEPTSNGDTLSTLKLSVKPMLK